MTSKVSHSCAGYPAVCRNATTLFVVQCVAVALRPTNDPMHGFARPTLRIEENDAIAQKPFCGWSNMVENRMLQIQHTDGNDLLTRLNEALKFQRLWGFGAVISLRRGESSAGSRRWNLRHRRSDDRARMCRESDNDEAGRLLRHNWERT